MIRSSKVGLIALWSVLAWAGTCAWTTAADEPAERPIDFVRDIRPILAKHCFACHGPDEASRESELRLDTRDGALGARPNGAAFVARRLDKSLALSRIESTDPEQRMPPLSAGPPLSADQIAALRHWVARGATWQSHWAFEKPVRPAVSPPHLRDWPLGQLDQLVLARLEHEQLRPSPEADRTTLARRAALDLTGLPPSPELVSEFVESAAPDAYERLVDRLLAAPSYGERWARPWLDVARYADTKGYEKDRTRTIWRYRDWLIDAFNSDLPFDQFTRDQLAGDLLPDATPSQLLATAMHRNTMVNEEGGTDDEEFRVAAVKDRVDTTIQAWMGLTMGCSKCHSHKYDPISQREYYQFYAFFNQTEDSDKGDDRPTAPIPTAMQARQLELLRAELAARETELRSTRSRLTDAAAAWAANLASRRGWSVLDAESLTAESGATLRKLDDHSVLASGDLPASEQYRVAAKFDQPTLTGLKLEAIPDPSQPRGGVGRSKDDGNFVLTGVNVVAKLPDGTERPVALASAEADFAQDNYPVAHALKNPDPRKHGWAVSPRQTQAHVAVFALAEPLALASGSRLIITLDHRFQFAYPGFAIGRFRLSATGDPRPSLRAEFPAAVLAIVRKPADQRSPAEVEQLTEHYSKVAPETESLRKAIANVHERIAAVKPPLTPVLRELPADKRRATRIHVRGNFLEPADEVAPAVPASFHPFPTDAPLDRRGVAEWLTSRDNPLTARVAANRVWSELFGLGLVETQEDFGSQGRPPSHPELLDWLALEFSGHPRDPTAWSWKELTRAIVLSATYRQSATASRELAQRDPANRLLARGGRPRLAAETVRDSALAVAGLLSHKMYGPSVMPPQPEGIWRSTYNTDKWVTSAGEDRYRRGLYTFLKRTSPYPSLTTLDSPSRETCVVRRIHTNTPLQALVTLNDPAFVECARELAHRACRESSGGMAAVDGPVARAFRLALARAPRSTELATLTDLYGRRLAEFQADAESARTFGRGESSDPPAGRTDAELAALAAVCNVLLNLDEFLTRG